MRTGRIKVTVTERESGNSFVETFATMQCALEYADFVNNTAGRVELVAVITKEGGAK